MADVFDHSADRYSGYVDLAIRRDGEVLFVAIDRPETRNALSEAVRAELDHLVEQLETDTTIRLVVLESANGVFCSGGDLKSFRATIDAPVATDGAPDPVLKHNRSYGTFLERFGALPQVVVARIEGPAMAGALGIICVCDVVIAMNDAKFGMTETSLGIIPAQIAPFVVARVGLPAARIIALTGRRFDGAQAAKFGLVDHVCASKPEADAVLADIVQGVLKCAPGANAVTKTLLRRAASGVPLPDTLDWAAEQFVKAMRGAEGREGIGAFLEKRAPSWVRK